MYVLITVCLERYSGPVRTSYTIRCTCLLCTSVPVVSGPDSLLPAELLTWLSTRDQHCHAPA